MGNLPWYTHKSPHTASTWSALRAFAFPASLLTAIYYRTYSLPQHKEVWKNIDSGKQYARNKLKAASMCGVRIYTVHRNNAAKLKTNWYLTFVAFCSPFTGWASSKEIIVIRPQKALNTTCLRDVDEAGWLDNCRLLPCLHWWSKCCNLLIRKMGCLEAEDLYIKSQIVWCR